MATLEHIAKEFEKVHDSLPKLEVRLAVVETWQKSHPDTHRLERVALDIDKRATDLRLEYMNELRSQINAERGTFVLRELYDRETKRVHELINTLREARAGHTGEQTELMKFLPWLLAAVVAIVAHCWK